MAIAVNARATSPFIVPRQPAPPPRTDPAPPPPTITDLPEEATVEVVADPEEPPRTEAESKQRVDLEILKRTIARRADSSAPPPVAPEPELPETEPPPDTAPPTVERHIEITVERSFSLEVQIERLELRRGEGQPPPEPERKDPLVLDLDGDGLELTRAEDGVLFDLDADGTLDRTAFATGDDALLAMDRDGDGRITTGAELFGDVAGAADGFADLAQLDRNGDGVVNAADPAFESLRLVNTEGSRTLAEAGVAGISVTSQAIHVERADGNAEVAQATFTRHDGSVGRVADVLLAYHRSALG